MLDSVPVEDRTGWLFCPAMQRGEDRLNDPRPARRIISRIGREAGGFVNDDGKPASAHDMRRSWAATG